MHLQPEQNGRNQWWYSRKENYSGHFCCSLQFLCDLHRTQTNKRPPSFCKTYFVCSTQPLLFLTWLPEFVSNITTRISWRFYESHAILPSPLHVNLLSRTSSGAWCSTSDDICLYAKLSWKLYNFLSRRFKVDSEKTWFVYMHGAAINKTWSSTASNYEKICFSFCRSARRTHIGANESGFADDCGCQVCRWGTAVEKRRPVCWQRSPLRDNESNQFGHSDALLQQYLSVLFNPPGI